MFTTTSKERKVPDNQAQAAVLSLIRSTSTDTPNNCGAMDDLCGWVDKSMTVVNI